MVKIDKKFKNPKFLIVKKITFNYFFQKIL